MKAFVTFIIVLVAAFGSLTGQATWPASSVTTAGGEYVVAEEEHARHELVQLTAMNANAVLVHQTNETVHFSPAFRYLSRHHFPLLAEEEEREFSPRFKYIATHYMTSFALRQHKGYYVFALREILV